MRTLASALLPSNRTKKCYRHYKFKVKEGSRSAAVLVLPDGGVHLRLRDHIFNAMMEEFVQEDAVRWYQYAKSFLSELGNGRLVLVSETYYARTWGIAAFDPKSKLKKSSSVELLRSHPGTFEFSWMQHDNCWKTIVGPPQYELDNLSADAKPPLTQCLGVGLYSVRLSDEMWKAHFPLEAPSSKLDPQTRPPAAREFLSSVRRLFKIGRK